MKPADRSPMTPDRLGTAAEWLIALRANPTDPQVVAAWLRWRQEHPDNSRAFSEIEEVWALAGDAETTLTPRQDTHAYDPAAVALPERSAARPQPWVRWSMAAGIAATALLSLLAWRPDLLNSDEPPVEYATAHSAQRELRLSDGSRLVLGGDSAVRVAFTDAYRNIELLHGEAHFAVQHDATRPFVVQAHGVAVTAIGTAFNVRADGSRTVVSVTEGVVEVGPGVQADKDAPTLQSRLRARAGQQVVLDVSAAMHPATLSVQLGDTLAANDWQQGLLSFVDEPLRTVITRVNRYYQHDIVIGDPDLGELRFTGTVFHARIGDWLSGLEKTFPIEANADAQGHVRLVRAPRKAR